MENLEDGPIGEDFEIYVEELYVYTYDDDDHYHHDDDGWYEEVDGDFYLGIDVLYDMENPEEPEGEDFEIYVESLVAYVYDDDEFNYA